MFSKLCFNTMLALVCVCTAYAQKKVDQTYVFQTNNIKIEIEASALYFSRGETLNVTIKITNLKDSTVLIFSDETLSSVLQEPYDILYLHFGEHFNAALETEIEMTRLKPSKTRLLKISTPLETFESRLKYRSFFLEIGIGYIDNEEKIRQYEHLGMVKTQITSEKVILSSIVIDALLTQLNVGGLKFFVE